MLGSGSESSGEDANAELGVLIFIFGIVILP
jgi:hypothetical protein